MKKTKETNMQDDMIQDFPIDIKKDILSIINDSPSIVRIGDNEYKVKNMRYYSLNRIFKLSMDMRQADESLDTDNKIIAAMCTDLDAMCEIMAIILCNHLFTPDDIHGFEDLENIKSRNEKLIEVMKAKVMYSTYDNNQWAAVVLGAIKSIDLTGFFLLRKSVNTLTDLIMTRKRKSEETASLFMEAQSLLTQPTSSERSHSTD